MLNFIAGMPLFSARFENDQLFFVNIIMDFQKFDRIRSD